MGLKSRKQSLRGIAQIGTEMGALAPPEWVAPLSEFLLGVLEAQDPMYACMLCGSPTGHDDECPLTKLARRLGARVD